MADDARLDTATPRTGTAVERSMVRINGEAVDGFVATRSGYEAVGPTKEGAIMALDKKIFHEEGVL